MSPPMDEATHHSCMRVVTTVLVLRGFNLNLEIRFDVPLRVQFAKDIKRFLITFWKLIFVPFSFERIILHCLSWFCYGASSIFMTFTKSALQMENNSLKNAVTNLSAGIQNDGLLSCAVGVVAESLTANSIGQGEASSSVGQPLLVYRSSCVYDVITLATGYMVVLPLVCAGFDIPIRTVASKIHYYLRKFLTRMVYPFFLIIHLGVLPLIYGWFLDICTIRMFGKSISDRVEFFSKFPLLSSSLHWAIGITYMFQIRISTSLLQRVLRKEVLHFLQDLADPIYNILYVVANDVQVKASQLLFFVAVVGTFIVFLVYLLVTLAMRLAPTIFPLHNSLSDPLTEIPVVMLLLQVCLPYAIELRETIGAVLYQWVTSVCCVLGLSDFLCSRPEDIGWQQNVKEERKQDRLIAAQDPNKNNNDGYTFVLRVVLLVILVWIPLLLLSSSLIIVFLPLRRVLFSSISYHSITHGVKCNNLYVFFVRNFSIWTSLTGARFFVEHFKPGKTHVQFSDICKLLRFIVEKCVLLSLWIIVIPVLIGLLFELSVMVSIQALVVEAPVLLLCQDLAVGFFFFKLWRTLVLLNHRIVLVDESWRVKFERIRDNDFLKLPGLWMLQEIMIPFIRNLLLSLCFPYIFARWIVPSLGLSQTVNSTVYRFTWVA
ncbi:probable E3 ubiquitin ligase SUD1 [Papaver somniferum]|uniref:probable E3 ubiquitin ligase SUD1 n=1 Tax=Papaver somniferum TaxID=3469 RepID=UPI000E6FB57A|nr:probable E3 ubiquitin ligase SUD1 [Papaver somniferum]